MLELLLTSSYFQLFVVTVNSGFCGQ